MGYLRQWPFIYVGININYVERRLLQLLGQTVPHRMKTSRQCRIQLFATIDSHTIIAKQKCDDQIWMTGREILQEITNKWYGAHVGGPKTLKKLHF